MSGFVETPAPLTPAADAVRAPKGLSAGTLLEMFLRLFTLQAVWNYERMQGIGFAYALAPAAAALAQDDAEAARTLVPQAGYFNTHPVMAAVAVGVVADQLERRARGEAALDDAGDPLFWNAVRPLLALTAVYGWRDDRSWFGVFTILAGYNTFAIGYRLRGLLEGYRRGLSYVAQLAQRLGPMTAGLRVLAGVVAALVVYTILVPTGGAQMSQVMLGALGVALGILFFGVARLGPGEWGIALVLAVLCWATIGSGL